MNFTDVIIFIGNFLEYFSNLKVQLNKQLQRKYIFIKLMKLLM